MVKEENKVKLLRITTVNELIFDSYILNIFLKAKKDKRLKYFSSQGYPLSRFLKHSLNIVLLYGCSVVDMPIAKLTSFTKDYMTITQNLNIC